MKLLLMKYWAVWCRKQVNLRWQSKQKILSTEIIELAAQEGISKRILETAKKKLKIKAERCNNNWYWNLSA